MEAGLFRRCSYNMFQKKFQEIEKKLKSHFISIATM